MLRLIQRFIRILIYLLGLINGLFISGDTDGNRDLKRNIFVRNVSLKVEAGKVVCLLGRNGVGKTTLLKSIMGLLKARKGSVSYQSEGLTRKAPGERAKKGIGYVPQGSEIFGQLTVYENLLLGLEAAKVKTSTIPEEAIAKFPVLPKMYERRGGV
jgi:urea transport system ATP-binding protein